MNETLEWVKVFGTLIGGGACGAFINAWFTNRRNRVQNIGQRYKTTKLFSTGQELKDHFKQITFTTVNDASYQYDNICLIDIELKNLGNTDYPEFKLGVNLQHGVAINIKTKGGDRHHEAQSHDNVDFGSPNDSFDIILKPFNRTDTYFISVWSTSIDGETPIPSFSTGHPIKFKELETSSRDNSDLKYGNYPDWLSKIFMGILIIFAMEYILNHFIQKIIK